MKKYRMLLALLLILVSIPVYAFTITLTGSSTTSGNFYFPCTPKAGTAILWVPALGGSKTLTVRNFTSDNTALYGNLYKSQDNGTIVQVTYTTPNNAAFGTVINWGMKGLGTTDTIGYNILCSDNTIDSKTLYITGECQ